MRFEIVSPSLRALPVCLRVSIFLKKAIHLAHSVNTKACWHVVWEMVTYSVWGRVEQQEYFHDTNLECKRKQNEEAA